MKSVIFLLILNSKVFRFFQMMTDTLKYDNFRFYWGKYLNSVYAKVSYLFTQILND